MIDIEALWKLEKAATPGPWAHILPNKLDESNNALACAARNALPDLLALLEEARELIPDLLCHYDGLCSRCDKARTFLSKFAY